MGLETVDCPDAYPEGHVCQGITFTFNNVRDTIENVIVSFKFRGNDQGTYDLFGGPSTLDVTTETSTCAEQEAVATIIPADFNSDDAVLFIVKDEVLILTMLYTEDGTNGCDPAVSLATANLKYDFLDCDRTLSPSSVPTPLASEQPSAEPSSLPSVEPSMPPSKEPSASPSMVPSAKPSMMPSLRPSFKPSTEPSSTPSDEPSVMPSAMPSAVPSVMPSLRPSSKPSSQPSSIPSVSPSAKPSSAPSDQPSDQPSFMPSDQPSSMPSCPIEVVDVFSPESGLESYPCPPAVPDGFTCDHITFTFTDVKDSIGDVTLTYTYKGDDSGDYILRAGTLTFNEDAAAEQCTAFQEVEVTRGADVFNSDGATYMKQDGVLDVEMDYVTGGANGCAGPITAKIRLQYSYFDCGT